MVPWILFAALTVQAASAAANLAPPQVYVETCTVENQERPEEECRRCDAHFGERDRCEREFGTKDYRYRCRTYGVSVWSEIWCRPSAQESGDKE
jgi:hypothetical protein